jgi:hypothetical protein
MGVAAAKAKALILALPGVEEGSSYGMPSFKLRGRSFARLRDDDAVLGLPTTIADRDVFTQIAPEIYFITDHYRSYPAVLIRLAAIEADELAQRIEEAWRMKATKTMVKAYNAGRA